MMDDKEFDSMYHKALSRKDALKLLQAVGQSGAFLFRDSQTLQNTKVLSVLVDAHMIVNLKVIETPDGRISIAKKGNAGREDWLYFDSIQQLIAECRAPSSTLPTPLTIPVGKKEYKDEVEYTPMSPTSKNIPSLPLDNNKYQNDNDTSPMSTVATTVSTFNDPIVEAHRVILDSVTCMACGGIAEDAVETSCCHNIFCEECLKMIQEPICPKCHQIFATLISHTTRRTVGGMPRVCVHEGCNEMKPRNQMKEHETACDLKKISCLFEDCNEEMLNRDLVNHLLFNHKDDVIHCVKKCKEIEQEDRMAVHININGDECRLGKIRKFYCGKLIDGPRCLCCGDKCGPLQGCNCSACMKLDVATQALAPNTYVNKYGYPSKKSTKNENFYCGRRVVKIGSEEGYCGPKKGQNCGACKALQYLVKTRYAHVWQMGKKLDQ